ncbi:MULTISPECIES: helix-turn-helix domain-containing protein [unclassified Roseovarius]|uniref:helix-turn-helix domain-containing protein n=1 Tax=unclassified Roseovarius TaxID=2614913 RepID=UPI003009AFB5
MTELYHYTDCGLPNVWLDGGVVVKETPYGTTTSIAALDNLHHEIAMDIITRASGMTGAEMRFLRIELDISQRALARMLKTSEKNIQRWEKHRDEEVPNGPACVALGALYVGMRSDAEFRELVQNVADLDREISELEHNMSFRLDGEHWEAA